MQLEDITIEFDETDKLYIAFHFGSTVMHLEAPIGANKDEVAAVFEQFAMFLQDHGTNRTSYVH